MAFTQINKNSFNSWFFSLISASLIRLSAAFASHPQTWKQMTEVLKMWNLSWTIHKKQVLNIWGQKEAIYGQNNAFSNTEDFNWLFRRLKSFMLHPWTSHSLSQHMWSYTFSTGLSWFFMQNLCEIWLSKVCVGGYMDGSIIINHQKRYEITQTVKM